MAQRADQPQHAARAEQGFQLVVGSLRSLGFTVNKEKCVPPTTELVFLGVGLSTDADGQGACASFIDAERKERLLAECTRVANAGSVPLHVLHSLLGKLSFVAMVLEFSRGFLRSGFATLKYALRRGVRRNQPVLVPTQLRMDLHWWCKAFKGASLRTMLHRRYVDNAFAAWDASVTVGLGAYYNGQHLSLSWAQLAALPDQRTYYPRVASSGRALSPINYLETFAAYWFLRRFASQLRGTTLVCFTDNTACLGMLTHMWGQAAYIPLLKQIRMLLLRFDVRLQVHYISTKDNVLADALSRGDMDAFRRANAAFLKQSLKPVDAEDWQLDPQIVRSDLDVHFGPFCTDGAVDWCRSNSHFARSWNGSVLEDCRRTDWTGRNVYCNGPFSLLLPILQRFLQCKEQSPRGTAALFVVPAWETASFYALLLQRPDVFTRVRRWETGTQLFTRPLPPHAGGGRRVLGPTRWPVEAWWASPTG